MEKNWDQAEEIPKTFKKLHSHHKSHISIGSLAFANETKELNYVTEKKKLQYNLEKITAENSELQRKIDKIESKYSNELKKRDEVIISLTNLMKEREESFKKIFEEQDTERNRLLGKKEMQLQSVKKALKVSKNKEEKPKKDSTQEIEIESLRKLLIFAEKENKELEKIIKNSNETADGIEKILESDLLDEVCSEISHLLGKISKVKSVIQGVLHQKLSIDLILSSASSDHYEVTRKNLVKMVRIGQSYTDSLETTIFDLYAMQSANKCPVQ